MFSYRFISSIEGEHINSDDYPLLSCKYMVEDRRVNVDVVFKLDPNSNLLENMQFCHYHWENFIIHMKVLDIEGKLVKNICVTNARIVGYGISELKQDKEGKMEAYARFQAASECLTISSEGS